MTQTFDFLSVSDFPTGFAYVAAALKRAGHEVFGLNLNNARGYPTPYDVLQFKLPDAVKEAKPDLIGLGGLCIDYRFNRDAIQFIRKLDPTIPIVLGGSIITHDAEFIFNTLKPDFCVIGDAEEAVVQLVSAIEGDKDYSHIANLGYWEKGTAVFTETDYNYPDINQRPHPDYEPFNVKDMVDNYSMATRLMYAYTRPYARTMPIVTARGCPFNCTFCIHQRGPRYRAHSIEYIMEEIGILLDLYKFNILIIDDELFAVNKQRMKDFCNALIKARKEKGWDFDWLFQTHPNARLDYETLMLAKEAGCYLFAYGMESASPAVLKSMNKHSDPAQFIEAIKLAEEVGIGYGGNLLVGDPAETNETLRETMEFFFRYCLDYPIFVVPVEPFPGSKIFEDCLERGLIPDKFEWYETTLCGTGKHINMTSLPDEVWNKTMHYLMVFIHTNFWIKSTPATRIEEEADSIKKPMVAITGRLVRRVWAVCPHCHEEVFYRGMMGGIPPVTIFIPLCPKCHKAFSIKLLDKECLTTQAKECII